jgi:CRISPR system Cascade subunit CasE
MMYLSKVILNPNSPAALRALADGYAFHQLIYSAFRDGPGDLGRVLYRVEEDAARQGAPLVLVQSEAEPDWEPIAIQGGAICSAVSKPFSPEFASEQVLRFRVRANPTVKRKFGEDAKLPGHRRVGLYKHVEQRAWLDRKAATGGFDILEVTLTGGRTERIQNASVSAPSIEQFRKPDPEATSGFHKVRHLSVTFNGLLRVTDPETFVQTLANGIGSAKGFGFGLLSVARV